MTTPTTIRYHYLDNLRAIAMTIGVVFHAAIAYAVITQALWPTAEVQTSKVVDAICWWLHTFRMPLFFLIAGFFGHYLVQKYGLPGFVKNRTKRVMLPFVIFWPLMVASILAIFYHAAFHMGVETPILNMIKFAFENPEAAQEHDSPTSTTHLWFLYYLSMFTLMAALTLKLWPKSLSVSSFISHPLTVILGFPALTLCALVTQFMPHPAAESFVPALWALVFYGGFYLAGWHYFCRQDRLDQLSRFTVPLCISAGIFSVIFIYFLPGPVSLEDMLTALPHGPEMTLPHLALSVCTAILSWHMTLLALIAGKKVLDKQNKLMRLVSDASYWIYIIHMPIIFYLQAHFRSVTLPIITEIALISAITLGIGYLSFVLLVKPTPIGWLLHGRKNKNRG